MKESMQSYKRIVVKIGSSLLYPDKTHLDTSLVDQITTEILSLNNEKKEIVIVSSGAIALGMSVLGISSRPKDLAFLQAAAAIGQHELMDVYRSFFKEKGLKCAQVLLTWDDFDNRQRYLNAKNTLLKLLELKSVPVINENDTVSTDEIKFGDNDKLSALVAGLIKADLLIILSDVDGLLEKDRKTVVRVVEEISAQVKLLACPTDKKTCVGGMITKLEAAKVSVNSGIPCVIANGRSKNILNLLVDDPTQAGTLFVPKKSYLAAKKHWIAFGTKPKGKIIVDEGAKKALLENKSLLSVGVVSLDGKFERTDIVIIADSQGIEFARGKSEISSKSLEEIKGRRSNREIIHRNNIVIL